MKTERLKNYNQKVLVILGTIAIIIGIAFILKTIKKTETISDNLNVLALTFKKSDGKYLKSYGYNSEVIKDIVHIENWGEYGIHKNKVLYKKDSLAKIIVDLEGKKKHMIELKELYGRLDELNRIVSNLNTLESSACTFKLNALNPENHSFGDITYDTINNVVSINYFKDNTSSFVHEATHAYQFVIGDIAFARKSKTPRDVKIRADLPLAADLFDEVSAYRAQYAYNPDKVTGLSSSSEIHALGDINTNWVRNVENMHPNSECTYPYQRGHIAREPVNIYTTVHRLSELYSGKDFDELEESLRLLKDLEIISYMDYEK